MKKKNIGVVIGLQFVSLLFLLVVLMFVAACIGTAQSSEYVIVHLRIPRIVMSVFAGASLAVCGAIFQSVFRNPVCDPYILGISSGASIGAAVAFILGLDLFLYGVTAFALITAFITLLILLGITRLLKVKSVYAMLLAGVSLNFLMAAVLTLLMVLYHNEMQKILFWTMGSFATISYYNLYFFIPIFVVCLFVTFLFSKDLDIMQLGEIQAQSLGVNTKRVINISLLTSSVLIAATVSVCGVIGFIGLIIPHLVRIIWGNNARSLFAFSILLGAIFMLSADTLARVAVANTELPVGCITALIGAPYFVYMLVKK